MASGDDSSNRLAEISSELEGLDRDARRERLIEIATDEGGELSFYGSTNVEDVAPVLEAFEDATGVSVSHYRASGSTVLNRLLEEASAGFVGADVVQNDGAEMLLLDGEGMLLPLDTPVRDDIVQSGQFETWLAPYVNAFIAAWNTDRVAEQARPGSWREVLEFEGVLSMDTSDFDWFATLVRGHFMAEEGMSEDEAVALFEDAARDAIIVSGHSIGSQMLVAGEFDLNAAMYHHHITRFPEDAPFAWEPPVEPIIVRPNGVGILASTTRPGTALLFLEFMLTDGQPLLVESGRTPGSTVVEGGLPADYDTLSVDLVSIDEERGKWESLYEEVILVSGREPIE